MDKFTHSFKFELGITAKSDISGFKGVVAFRAQNLNGCDRYFLVPKVDKDGKLAEGHWFDDYEIMILSNVKIKRKKLKNWASGHPNSIK